MFTDQLHLTSTKDIKQYTFWRILGLVWGCILNFWILYFGLNIGFGAMIEQCYNKLIPSCPEMFNSRISHTFNICFSFRISEKVQHLNATETITAKKNLPQEHAKQNFVQIYPMWVRWWAFKLKCTVLLQS